MAAEGGRVRWVQCEADEPLGFGCAACHQLHQRQVGEVDAAAGVQPRLVRSVDVLVLAGHGPLQVLAGAVQLAEVGQHQAHGVVDVGDFGTLQRCVPLPGFDGAPGVAMAAQAVQRGDIGVVELRQRGGVAQLQVGVDGFAQQLGGARGLSQVLQHAAELVQQWGALPGPVRQVPAQALVAALQQRQGPQLRGSGAGRRPRR